MKIINPFNKWLSKLIGNKEVNKLDEDYDDYFRIKVITLKSKVNKYFPQYKSDSMSSWETLVSINNKGIGTFFISDDEMITTTMSYVDNEDEAKNMVNSFKEQLINNRSSEYLKEQIIPL